MKFIKKIVNNDYLFSVISKIVSVATGLIYTVLYSRYLGKELRGTASVINNYAEIIMMILCFGVYQAYPYFKKTKPGNRYNEFINNAAGMFLFYALIACVFLITVRPSANVFVITVSVPIMVAVRQFNYVVLIENPKRINIMQIVVDVFDIVFLTVLMIFTKSSYFYCILFLLTRTGVSFIIAVSNLKVPLKTIRPTLKNVWQYVKYGFVPMLTLLLMEVNYKVDIVMLERMSISNAEIGVYSLGVMLAQKLWMIPDALKDILTGKLAHGRTAQEVCKITRVSLFVTAGCIIGMIIFGKPLINIIFGAEYEGAYRVFLNISLGVLGMVFYKMIYAYNVVNGHKNINFVLLFVAAVSNVVLNYFFIQKMGINGAAIASMISYSVCGISFLIYFIKDTKQPLKSLLLIKKDDIGQLKGFIRK